MVNMKSCIDVLLLIVIIVGTAFASDAANTTTQSNVLSADNKTIYAGVKSILLRSAEKMPEETYSFKPTDAVRSYGQILGHVADAQYLFCSSVLGEKNP